MNHESHGRDAIYPRILQCCDVWQWDVLTKTLCFFRDVRGRHITDEPEMSASRQFSNTRFLFSFSPFFFPPSNSSYFLTHATRGVTCHQGVFARTVTVWHHSHVRWLCVTVLLLQQIPAPFPQTMHERRSHTKWVCTVWHFPSKRMENILQICPVAAISSGTVQLNADLNHASSFRLTHTTSSREHQCLPSLRA